MELIDRAALLDDLRASVYKQDPALAGGIGYSVAAVEDAPTIDAAPVVHAYWRRVLSKGCRNPDFVCNACDSFQMHVTKYCPNCGAFMDAAAAARAGKEARHESSAI